MNKKGFTLIELLAVIVIISIIASIATINVLKIRNDSFENLLETKIQNLEAAAIVYGQENPDKLDDACTVNDVNYSYCTLVTVNDLIEESYFKSSETNSEENIDLINNVTNESMLNDKIQIYRKNNSVYANYIGK